MTRSDIRKAFISGWRQSAAGVRPLEDALERYEQSLPKRRRRWFKKPARTRALPAPAVE
jgi:hypothetical protein